MRIKHSVATAQPLATDLHCGRQDGVDLGTGTGEVRGAGVATVLVSYTGARVFRGGRGGGEDRRTAGRA